MNYGSLNSTYSWFKAKIAEACLLNGDHIEAIKKYEEILALWEAREYREESGAIHSKLGMAWLSIGDMERAKNCFLKAPLSAGEYFTERDLVDLLLSHGVADFSLGNISRAIQHYEKAFNILSVKLRDVTNLDSLREKLLTNWHEAAVFRRVELNLKIQPINGS